MPPQIKIPTADKIEGMGSPISTSHSTIAFEDYSDEEFDALFMTAEQKLAAPPIRKTINFGWEGTGKTHLGCGHPGPVVILESEPDRAQLIIGKFKNPDGTQKEFRIMQWRDYDSLLRGVNLAIGFLNKRLLETGQIGTLMIDNYTESWTVSQEKYRKVHGYSPTKKLSPRDDFGGINVLHNAIRKKILDCGFHLYCTAMVEELFEDEDNTFKVTSVRAAGQKHDQHKFDYVINSYLDENGNPICDMGKTSIVAGGIAGIKMMDYAKFEETIEKLENKVGINRKPMLTEIPEDDEDFLAKTIEEETQAETPEKVPEETPIVEEIKTPTPAEPPKQKEIVVNTPKIATPVIPPISAVSKDE